MLHFVVVVLREIYVSISICVLYFFISLGRPKQIKIINKDKKFIGKGGILLWHRNK